MNEATTMDAKQEQKSRMPKWMRKSWSAVWGQTVELGEGISQISSDTSQLFIKVCEGIVKSPNTVYNWSKTVPDKRKAKKMENIKAHCLRVITDVQLPSKRHEFVHKATLFQILMRDKGVKINLDTCKEILATEFPDMVPKKKAPAKKAVTKKAAPKVKKTTVKKKTAAAGK